MLRQLLYDVVGFSQSLRFYGAFSWTILYELTRIVFTTTHKKHLLLLVEWLKRVLPYIVDNARIIEKLVIIDSYVTFGKFIEIGEILIDLSFGKALLRQD